MVRIKKKKKIKDKSEEDAKKAIEKKEEKPKDEKPEKPQDEPAPLPAFKVTLKKQVDNSGVKMKGASLNLLGSYDSGSSSNEENG